MQDPDSTSQCCGSFRAKFADWKNCAEKSVREQPIKTAGLAFVAGLAMTVLPVGRVLGGALRLAVALIKPGLLILGVIKLAEELEQRKKS